MPYNILLLINIIIDNGHITIYIVSAKNL